MNDWLMQFYHRSPYPLKVLAASAKGYYLRWLRYGPETEMLVQEAMERETWSREKWRAWQEERLTQMLHRAAARVPYYREQWTRRRRQGDLASWECLENWPVLEKEPLRQNPTAFVADGCEVRRLYPESTSGSTGTPLVLWKSRKTIQAWYGLFDARWRRWYGVSRHDRWAILGGKLVAPVERREPPFWVWNTAMNQLYMSTYHLAPGLIHHYLNALRRYRIKYLWGYSSALYSLSQEVLRSGRFDLNMKVVVTDSEPLFDYQRQTICEAFRCPVRETYGMGEAVAAASECEFGKLHLWPEAGFLEVCNGGRPVSPGTPGDLVCTGLMNLAMPLVRYRTGDRGIMPPNTELCSCGRTLPLITAIVGRIDDLVYTPDGRPLGQQLDTFLSNDMHLREAQIIQDRLDQFRIRFVPMPGFTPEIGRRMVTGLQNRIGKIQVTLEPVAEIPRGANGKFRFVLCNLSPEEKRHLK